MTRFFAASSLFLLAARRLPNPQILPQTQSAKRARFYESMADEREARGDTEGIIKAAEYRQTAAKPARRQPRITHERKNESGNQTEKAVKAKKGRRKPDETPDSAAVDVGDCRSLRLLTPEAGTGARGCRQIRRE